MKTLVLGAGWLTRTLGYPWTFQKLSLPGISLASLTRPPVKNLKNKLVDESSSSNASRPKAITSRRGTTSPDKLMHGFIRIIFPSESDNQESKRKTRFARFLVPACREEASFFLGSGRGSARTDEWRLTDKSGNIVVNARCIDSVQKSLTFATVMLFRASGNF